MEISKELFVFDFKVGGNESISQRVLVSTVDCSMLKSEKYIHEREFLKLHKEMQRAIELLKKTILDTHDIFEIERFIRNIKKEN